MGWGKFGSGHSKRYRVDRGEFGSDTKRVELDSVSHRLTVVGIHACFDLRVNPQRRSLLHGAQQERLKVQKHFVVPFPVLGRLVRDDCREIPIPASASVRKTTK